jgi:hypothetical protein
LAEVVLLSTPVVLPLYSDTSALFISSFVGPRIAKFDGDNIGSLGVATSVVTVLDDAASFDIRGRGGLRLSWLWIGLQSKG